MSCSLSTHVLDTAAGRPAAGVRIELRRDGELVASAETDDNLGKEFHPEEGPLDAYDAAVIRRREDGKGFDPRCDSGVLGFGMFALVCCGVHCRL